MLQIILKEHRYAGALIKVTLTDGRVLKGFLVENKEWAIRVPWPDTVVPFVLGQVVAVDKID